MRRNCYSALCLCKAVLRSSASQTSELVGTTWDFVKILILIPEVCVTAFSSVHDPKSELLERLLDVFGE